MQHPQPIGPISIGISQGAEVRGQRVGRFIRRLVIDDPNSTILVTVDPIDFARHGERPHRDRKLPLHALRAPPRLPLGHLHQRHAAQALPRRLKLNMQGQRRVRAKFTQNPLLKIRQHTVAQHRFIGSCAQDGVAADML